MKTNSNVMTPARAKKAWITKHKRIREREKLEASGEAPLLEYLTPGQCAMLRHTTKGNLGVERSKGTGPPYIKSGGRVLYPLKELREWMQARIVVPGKKKAAA